MPKTRSLRGPPLKWRTATHSGSWYEDNVHILSQQMDKWLEDTDGHAPIPPGRCRAVIAPHAGYRYCGHVMAHAYRHMNPNFIKRIFILGPSHHFYSRRCHLSPNTHYCTPMGQIEIDEGIYRKLTSTNHFPVMSKEEDEAEHSLELHLPFIMHRMEGREFTVVPIVVGALNSKDEAFYADLLSEYFLDPQNFFIISSDFCHWGSRFSYMYWEREDGEIHESVEKLDRRAMATIEAADPAAFSNYLLETKNTICGRHPIGVFLNLLQLCHGPKSACVRFTKYDQSQRCKSTWESSVSYAAAVVMLSDVLDGVTEDVGDAVA